MAKKSYKGMKTLRLTEAQLTALKELAAKDTTLAAMLPTHKERSGNGLEVKFTTTVMKDPTVTLQALKAEFPTLKEPRVKFLRRQADNAIVAAKAAGRWNDKIVEVKPDHKPAATKKAA